MVARLRVATSGSAARSDDYGDGVATAGRLLTSGGPGLAPNWTAPVAGVAPVAQTFFVDAVNFAAVPTGTLGAPFQTLQQAINQAVANAWTFVQIIIAPATYADPVAIPIGLAVSFHGWDVNAAAVLGGDITITGGIGSSDVVSFTNCLITAVNIAAADPLTQDITLSFQDTFNSAAIASFNANLFYLQSTQGGNITTTGLTISWDGYSWARTLQVAPAIVPAAYTRQHLDAGHDTYRRALAINGVPLFPAVGSTVFVDLVVPAYVRADDLVQIQTLDPAVRDFNCGVHAVDPGSVTVWLTNLSRASTNFNEAILLLVHHEAMIAEPPP